MVIRQNGTVSENPAMMKGKYFVFVILTIGAVLTAALLIFKPGPMSARKVAHLKQMGLFGRESDFRISQTQIDTMSIKQLDSAIVLFNHLERTEDTLDLVLRQVNSSSATIPEMADAAAPDAVPTAKYDFADFYRLQNREKVMLAYLDLLSGRLHDQQLVDSLAALALEQPLTEADNEEFERLHSELYGSTQ